MHYALQGGCIGGARELQLRESSEGGQPTIAEALT